MFGLYLLTSMSDDIWLRQLFSQLSGKADEPSFSLSITSIERIEILAMYRDLLVIVPQESRISHTS